MRDEDNNKRGEMLFYAILCYAYAERYAAIAPASATLMFEIRAAAAAGAYAMRVLLMLRYATLLLMRVKRGTLLALIMLRRLLFAASVEILAQAERQDMRQRDMRSAQIVART